MGKISLKVEIAGRTYPLTVQEGEEKKVLKAAEDINKAISLLKTNYSVSDSQDLLAMSSLQFMLKGACIGFSRWWHSNFFRSKSFG